MSRMFTEDVSLSAYLQVQQPKPQPIIIKEAVSIAKKRIRWNNGFKMLEVGSVVLTGPYKTGTLYYCPQCFALFVRKPSKCGKPISLDPLSGGNKPSNMMVRSVNHSALEMFNKHCVCDCEMKPIKTYEMLDEITLLNSEQVKRLITEC